MNATIFNKVFVNSLRFYLLQDNFSICFECNPRPIGVELTAEQTIRQATQELLVTKKYQNFNVQSIYQQFINRKENLEIPSAI